MMDRLRSSMRTLGVIASTVIVLSLAGIGVSQARPPQPLPPARQQPCNAVCQAYMAWSHRVTAMFRPSRSIRSQTTAARLGRPARTMMAHHAPGYAATHAPGRRRPGLNSFAQWPAQGDAAPADTRPAEEPTSAADTPHAAETPPAAPTVQAEAAPRDQIADRFPTVREFLSAQRADSDSATNDPADGPAFAVAGPVPHDASASDADIRLIAALLIALSTLPTLRFFKQVDRLARRRPPAQSAAQA